jgi:large conductance mechanosensitive channel
MPTIGVVLPGGEWRNAQLTLSGQNAIKYGDLAGRILDFLIVALVVFALTKLVLEKPAPAATTKSCPECLEAIPIAARKCRTCGSAVA